MAGNGQERERNAGGTMSNVEDTGSLQPEQLERDQRSCPVCGKSTKAKVCPHDGTALGAVANESKDKDPLIGTVIVGRYQIISRLGSTSTSALYRANHLLMDRDVAIRFLTAADVQSVKRFQIEAKVAVTLKHPNIVKILDFGVSSQGRPYIVMDYLEENHSLAHMIKVQGPLSVAQILNIFIQICDALNYAHKQDIIHRYLQPSNIHLARLTDGTWTVKLTDFGISKKLLVLGKEVDNLAHRGIIYGNPVYLSPECCLGSRQDARSDIYALGCILYEAITGVPPFTGFDEVETMHRHVTKTAPPFNSIIVRSELPERFEKIVFRALQKDPEQRYQNVTEIWTELEVMRHGAQQIEQVRAKHIRNLLAMSSETQKKVRRLLSFAAILLLGIGLGSWFGPMREELTGKLEPAPKVSWQELTKQGEQAFEAGDYRAAEPLFAQALSKAEGFEPDDPRLATSLNNLGNLDFIQDLYPEAENALKRALAIRKKCFGADGLPVAATLNDLGMVYLAQEKTAEARPLIERAYEIRRKNLSPEHEDIGQSLQVLGALYHREGDLKDAMTALKRALYIRKKTLGEGNPDVATTYNSLGMQYQLLGEYKQAKDCYQKARDIALKSLGPNHPLVADSDVGLATLDFLQGKYVESEDLFEKAKAIREEALGKSSFRTGEVFSCLGIVEERKGNLAESERLLRRSLEIYEQALPPTHPELARTLRNIARVVKKEGNREMARRLEGRAAAILDGQQGPNDAANDAAGDSDVKDESNDKDVNEAPSSKNGSKGNRGVLKVGGRDEKVGKNAADEGGKNAGEGGKRVGDRGVKSGALDSIITGDAKQRAARYK